MINSLNLKDRKKFDFNNHILESVLVLLMIVIAVLTPGFMTSNNLLNMLKNVSLQGVIALGLTMTIIGGQIDLSVGSGVALYGVIVAKIAGDLSNAGIMPLEKAVFIGMAAAFISSFIVGIIIAWLHIHFRMPTFIITLAFLNILYRGLADTACQFHPRR
jgi:ribose/xylose/arabinose/galactoside ABC-type transport system permease subunit